MEPSSTEKIQLLYSIGNDFAVAEMIDPTIQVERVYSTDIAASQYAQQGHLGKEYLTKLDAIRIRKEATKRNYYPFRAVHAIIAFEGFEKPSRFEAGVKAVYISDTTFIGTGAIYDWASLYNLAMMTDNFADLNRICKRIAPCSWAVCCETFVR